MAILITIFLSACGFQPLYGGNEAAQAHYAKIEISSIANREGQYLRNQLIDRLYGRGSPGSPDYVLMVFNVSKRITGLGIRKDATSTRGQIDISATMRLVDKNTNAVLLERKVSASGGYNRLDDRFATLVSETRSTDLALKQISEAVVTELDLYFRREGQRP